MASRRRDDGRETTEMRPNKIEVGSLARMDGSGLFGFGSTQILASFHGPQEVRIRDERVDRATLEVNHRALDGIAGTPSKTLASTIESIYTSLLDLHLFPRSLVQLNIQSLSPSHITSPSLSQVIPFSARAAAINACTLAILDAGSVGLRGTVVAVSIAELSESTLTDPRYRFPAEAPEQEGDVFVLDPTVEEEGRAKSKHVVAWIFGAGLSSVPVPEADEEDEDMERKPVIATESECVYLESEGSFDPVTFQKAYSASREACRQILATFREELQKR